MTREGQAPRAGALRHGPGFAVGGWRNVILDTVQAYDPASNTWMNKAPLSVARMDTAVAVAGGKLYAIGGATPTQSQTASVESYDPGASAWVSAPSLPAPRMAAGVAVVDGTIYLIGGQGPSGPSSTVYVYDTASDGGWSTSSSALPQTRYYLGAAAVGKIIYAVGGTNGANVLTTVDALDPTAPPWKPMPPMPTGRSNLSTVGAHGVLFAISGQDQDALPTLEAFRPVVDGGN